MPDRADFLAKRMLARLTSLEAALAEDGISRDEERARRSGELIEKILAVDAGVTDSRIVQLVVAALPGVSQKGDFSQRDRDELADFLRKHLPHGVEVT